MESADSDEEQEMVYIPGLCREGNCRQAPKTKSSKAVSTKPSNAGPGPAAPMDSLSDWRHNPPEQQVVQPEAGIRSASLKDLCPEDKRRIANLIKELARVSEEKEVTEERLKTEHESFEKKIRHLEEQNNLIAAEREDILFQQYRECQELLSLYQKYLSEQQEKLNLSVSEAPITRQHLTASELDGSYLGQQNHKAGSESGSLCSIVPQPLCRSDPTSRSGCHRLPPDRCSSRNCLPSKCPDARIPHMHYTDFPCGHHCSNALKQAVSHCCLHPPVHDTIRRSPPDLSLVRPPEDCLASRCSPMIGVRTGEQARDSAVGKGVSEQRKQELLLQKLEVEIEKERLQQLLAQQEIKLLEKQQQLQHARLEANSPKKEWRGGVCAQPPLRAYKAHRTRVFEIAGNLISGQDPVIPTPPSSKSRRKQQSPNKAVPEGRTSRVAVEGQEGDGSYVLPQCTVSKGSRKDTATSPTVKSPRTEMRTVGTSLVHRDLHRYETSLIDMLEAISPISSERRRPPHREPYDFSILSPIPHGHSKEAVRRREPPSVDPEEREMLEDIFFIC
ncbi:hypothetical protein GDO78_007871 [Eleutherodactylus coqui]|uniref:Protein hinderin n=1 Tax=Eleutherodactylus coqui TaxID=57060 RepID=A0A8J6KCW3_ELECQ|nr:hypothetical protein GDO78_007871 [Eleutherodactylus coqui]